MPTSRSRLGSAARLALLSLALIFAPEARHAVADDIVADGGASARPRTPAAAPVVPGYDLDALPPHDPKVLTGKLDNGLRWFVMANEKPEKRVELRLAVKVGSIQETDAERGLAHFNEHMNFNGTEHFESGELVSYLESIGSRFGADSNAYTSYDETVYMLHIPTDVDGAVDKGLQILADWAGRAKLEATEIDKERGVVLDELRGRKGAGQRIREKQDRVLLRDSQYAERRPIGVEEVIKDASHDTVRGFYRKWYRPDAMAVVVVGQVDAEAMATRVRELFGKLEKPAEPTVIPLHAVPAHGETLYSVESDKELTGSSVSVTYKHEPRPTRTIGENRDELVDTLASFLLTMRLYERTLNPSPPFMSANAGTGEYVKSLDVFRVSAQAKEGQLPVALAALMEEIDRARAHGFVAAELERVKTQILAFNEKNFKESKDRRSEERVGGIVGAFLDDEVVTSDEFDYEVAKAMVPSVTVAEVNDALRRLTDTRSRVVLVQAPDKEGAVPTVEQLREGVEPTVPRVLEAYVDDMAGKELMTFVPEAGHVVSRAHLPRIDVEMLTLSNGARVLLKKTDFRADEVFLSGFARGGTASAGHESFVAAARAVNYASQSGLGEFTQPQLNKFMQGSGRIASAGVGAGRFSRSADGSCRPQDFETMMQLLHLRFMQPAFREEAFARLIEQEVQYLRNQRNSPGGVFGIAFEEVATDDHWLFRTPTVERVQALDRADLEARYRAMFDDASEWTFVVVGSIDPEAHVPLIERYIGSLPTTSATPVEGDASYRYLDIHPKAPGTRREVVKGIEDQSRTQLLIPARIGLDQQEIFELDAALDLLEIRLREKLREERGDTYGVGVGYSDLAPYPGYGRVNISFGSSPDQRASMVGDVVEAIRWLKATTPDDEDMKKLREMRMNSLEEAEKENGWWTGQLRWHSLMGRDLETAIHQNRLRIERLNPQQIRGAARRWLDEEAIIDVHLVPETWSKPQRESPTWVRRTAEPAVEAPEPAAPEAKTADPAPAPAS